MFDSKFWSKYFKVYDVLNLVIPYQELMAELESELQLNMNDVVLDVGSGTGNLMIKIKGKCKDVIGIDYSIEGVNLHKRKDQRAKVIIHDITKPFPLPDEYFSKVVSNNTIYTLTENQQLNLIKEIYRVARPGAKVVVSNVKKGYDPFRIYVSHIMKSFIANGIVKTIFLAGIMMTPTLKVFYYNGKIKKAGMTEQYHFLTAEEQKKLLSLGGFQNISGGKMVYGNQAILNSAYKM